MKRSENRLILYHRIISVINKHPVKLHHKFLVMDKCVLLWYKLLKNGKDTHSKRTL